jgi:hypothetical protein
MPGTFYTCILKVRIAGMGSSLFSLTATTVSDSSPHLSGWPAGEGSYMYGACRFAHAPIDVVIVIARSEAQVILTTREDLSCDNVSFSNVGVLTANKAK